MENSPQKDLPWGIKWKDYIWDESGMMIAYSPRFRPLINDLYTELHARGFITEGKTNLDLYECTPEERGDFEYEELDLGQAFLLTVDWGISSKRGIFNQRESLIYDTLLAEA